MLASLGAVVFQRLPALSYYVFLFEPKIICSTKIQTFEFVWFTGLWSDIRVLVNLLYKSFMYDACVLTLLPFLHFVTKRVNTLSKVSQVGVKNRIFPTGDYASRICRPIYEVVILQVVFRPLQI